MGAFWNPHGGMVVSDKKLSKNEVSHLKREWLASITILWVPSASGGKKSKWL